MKQIVFISAVLLLSILFISTCNSQSFQAVNITGDVPRIYTSTYDYYKSRYFNVTLRSFSGQIFGNTAASDSYDQLNFYFNASNLNVYYNYTIYTRSSRYYYASDWYNFNYRPSCIVEYLETNGKPGYQYLQDQVVGWLRLNVGYSFSNSTDTIYSNTGGYSKVYTYTTPQESTTNVFSMSMYFSESGVKINNVAKASSQSMLSMTISNYYSSSNPRTDSFCDSPAECVSTGPSSYTQSRLALVSVIFSDSSDFGTDLGKAKMMLTTTKPSLLIGGTWPKIVSTNQYNTNMASNVYTTANNSVNDNMFVFEKFGYYSQVLIHSFDPVRPNYLSWNGPVVGVVEATNASFKLVIPTCLIIVLVLFNLF
ncbi:hypothetical protein CYY_004404 [Polysphondylium violaceum]|uniref:Transmembrane protein n=1 Tax=Polysphondylium violaceum TaxID=133409 RepID=A0A8J4PVF1_9MYCE|nr:hypothetical protein CYY_004404 [Polysphondylium violaceum]